MSKKVMAVVVCLAALLGVGAYYIAASEKTNPFTSPKNDTDKTSQTTENKPEGFDKNMFKLDEPGSPWWVVNKKRPLPAGYVPPDLAVPDVKLRLGSSAEQMQYSLSATPALKEMFAAAARENVFLVFGSGYRSEALQRQFYNSYVAQDGQAAADRYSARPGTSEHQTGLSFDATASNGACHLEKCFANTPEGKWLATNAYKYGYIIRYAEGKESITGYDYEPWHMRYVGKELATEMHRTGTLTLEEFFNLPPAPNY
jgi:D-alanyl-D-alanine carboxypeptidase